MPKQSRERDFLVNIMIYGIGNIGAKFIAFLMVPLYTYYVSPEDFGVYDVYLGLIFLIMPILTFDFRDGSFRLLLEEEHTEYWKTVITYTYRIIGKNILVATIIYICLLFFYPFKYALEAYGMLLVFSIYEVHTQILRGINKNRYYVFAGILSTFLTGVLSVLFVVWGKLGVEGIFISNIISRILVLGWIEWQVPIFRKFIIKGLKKREVRHALLHYSLPLLPNVVCWWVLSTADRLIIMHYLGSEANGIYAVANKLSLILGTFSTIIYQAWQDTAIRQYQTPDRDLFFSRIFNLYTFYLGVLLVTCAIGLKIVLPWIVDASYQDSFYYIYPCFLTVFFFALSSFLDLGYQCSKQTKKMMPSILLATVINLSLNLIFIQYLGLQGVIIASIISYAFLFVYRIFDTRQFFRIVWKFPSFIALSLLFVTSIIYYYVDELILLILFQIGVLGISWKYLPDKIKQKVYSIIDHGKK